jgi:hypothetical protein
MGNIFSINKLECQSCKTFSKLNDEKEEK